MAVRRTWLGRLPAESGLAVVLLALGFGLTLATLHAEQAEGPGAAAEMAGRVLRDFGPTARLAIVAGPGRADREFAIDLEKRLSDVGRPAAAVAVGPPFEARKKLAALAGEGGPLEAIVASRMAGRWSLFTDLAAKVPGLGSPKVLTPATRYRSAFLAANNLLNVANQVAVMAILAAGMTLVIITGHIDLSVGSLIALSAVVGTLLIREYAGAEQATPAGMIGCGLAAVLICGLVGASSGILVTRFGVPSFIITLGVLMIASGVSSMLAEGQTVYQLPVSFAWLGGEADFLDVPNAVWLMALLYLVVHVLLTRTTLGRYVYAVGGNLEAARLAGVRVNGVVVLVFALNGLLAGLGGMVLASRLKSGSPTFGQEYELYVIAAVVVGGTSLAGGEGNVIGTLLGAFLLATIQNGMNLTGVGSYPQRVVLGSIIIAAVLFDRLKRRLR